MLDLTNIRNLKTILAQHSLKSQKRLGQHFLVDRQVLRKLLEAAEISPSDVVVEVGAGIGTITVEIAKRAKEIYAVEIDKNLIPILKSHINDFKNVNTIQGDILRLNFSKFATSSASKVIGAIPYQITSPLLHHLLTCKNPPSLIATIIQKEVAEKIIAKPPKATYLSNFVGLFGKVEIVGKPIPPSTFWPQPDVYSAILRITLKCPIINQQLTINYSSFLHQGFSHPRKMLKKVFDEELLIAAGISSSRRAQTLTQEEWLKLFRLSTATLHR